MTESSVLHCKNDTGGRDIFIGVKKFSCAGAAAPFDHPHVYLTMAGENEKLCPYCSTIYHFDRSLRHGETRPAGCVDLSA